MAEGNKLSNAWDWLRDESNRKVLAFLGSGLVAAASGLWVAYQSGVFSVDEPAEEARQAAAPPSDRSVPPQGQSVQVQGGGVAAGRDFHNVGDLSFGAPAGPAASAQGSPSPSSPTAPPGSTQAQRVEVQGGGVATGRDFHNKGDLKFGN